ncbi:MAG: hypothetical protein ABID54_10410, partial [Pseudomonadota bacterium]
VITHHGEIADTASVTKEFPLPRPYPDGHVAILLGDFFCGNTLPATPITPLCLPNSTSGAIPVQAVISSSYPPVTLTPRGGVFTFILNSLLG